MQAHDPVTEHFRLTPQQQSALRVLGIRTLTDILYHFPSRYERAGQHTNTEALVPGSKVTLFGILSKLEAKKLWKSRRPATEGYFEDGRGRVKVMWFNQPYIAKMAPQGVPVQLTGTVGGSAERPYISNPEIIPSPIAPTGLFQSEGEQNQLFPVYPESRGITSLWFYHAVKKIIQFGALPTLGDPIPELVRNRYNLPSLSDALIWIHTPEKESHALTARKRFAFEEIFVIQTVRAQERVQNNTLHAFPILDAPKSVEEFIVSAPFPPTRAQKRAISEIISDFTKQHPMARLLEGDVGAGKTWVAAAASYAVVKSRPPSRNSGTLQVAYMAPTEILAQQHFESFIQYFKHLPINIGLITGSSAWKFPSKSHRDKATPISRAQLLKWVKNGEIAMLIGTHALIQKSVQFQNLALCIVDEQHRFGTAQRRALARKSSIAPHFLSMTATPIPRTLALTLYGDLDLSILDELPPGRVKITTHIVETSEREKAYTTIRTELKKGRQAYVICPRIDEPDPSKWNAVQAKSAKAERTRLQKDIFTEYNVGLLHGGMKAKEKDAVMEDFTQKKIDVLVATSVVEVGVNVPNATAIMIEGAERFGLAQLHQLRGRVQRSSHPPVCFLVPEKTGAAAMKRLKALEKSSDGFALAETDLENRGAGDLLGRKQWGVTDVGMEALQNMRLITAAREEAQKLVAHNATLSGLSPLRERVEHIAHILHRE
ncbi:ATP-dependent DNA helicase RecG [bacterium]|nr:ATP-dependent DNA helicase RecG [bacterium]